jgi:hypothetical protein
VHSVLALVNCHKGELEKTQIDSALFSCLDITSLTKPLCCG